MWTECLRSLFSAWYIFGNRENRLFVVLYSSCRDVKLGFICKNIADTTFRLEDVTERQLGNWMWEDNIKMSPLGCVLVSVILGYVEKQVVVTMTEIRVPKPKVISWTSEYLSVIKGKFKEVEMGGARSAHEGKRPLGKIRRRCEDNIRMDLREV